MAQFQRGDQIAYIPDHAEGKLTHPDVEFGFVTSTNDSFVFCRYWRKGELGTLRTTANSEATPRENLVHHNSVDQEAVDQLLAQIDKEDLYG